jgi:pyridoxamine 5'-phosphate oxidase
LCEVALRGKRRGMATDPHLLFEEWFALARESEINDPNAMALATANEGGRPSVRMVLLKGHDERGFVFYTNQDSRKGNELEANPWRPCSSTGSRCGGRFASRARCSR